MYVQGLRERERERCIERKRLKVGAGGGEEITWCHDLALVHNLMMNTRPVQHGRLSQWGPISLWLDLWHIYPLYLRDVTSMEREGVCEQK